MDGETVRGYFNEAATVLHYARAVANVGLWESERMLIEKWLRPEMRVLDLGCGAGRTTLGLWRLGFRDLLGADVAEEMVREARSIAECVGAAIRYERQDATGLPCADASFDAVVFAFNGLMQIPGRDRRLQAMREVARALRPGGIFIFSALDREDSLYARVFADTDNIEHDLRRNAELIDYGDRLFRTEHGTTFMHVPLQAEVRADLLAVGFEVMECPMRSALTRESSAVRDFSEDCRMYVARKR